MFALTRVAVSQSLAARTTRIIANSNRNKLNLVTRNCGSRLYSTTTDGQDTPVEVDQLSTHEYHKVSDEFMELLTDHLEDLAEEFPQIDAEYSHGVLNLELPPNGSYVINKQPPNKQIWVSSPVSGPDRFDLIGGRWVSLRNKWTLGDLLRNEVSEAIGKKVQLRDLE